MKIVHITPHLGGGVGKAHAALCAADGEASARHYVLLEEPRDRRHVDDIRKTGTTVTIAPDRRLVHDLMATADIVQFEWWNHPLMCGLLAGPPLPAMRSVFWSHVSGIAAPFIPAGLVAKADRFVFTSACSRHAPNLSAPACPGLERTAVINSGFVHAQTGAGETPDSEKRGVSYLGTVEFTKMSPAMMQVADRIDAEGTVIDIWGAVADDSPVHGAVSAMKNPGRIRLRGHTPEPMAALAGTSVFLYLLQPFHFGTAENALIEAMSLGCAPLVFANPCEVEIVRDGETGLVARSAEHAIQLLDWMLDHPDEVRRMGDKARAEVLETKTPERSLTAFRDLWRELMREPKQAPDFAASLGPTPRDWYEALQGKVECGNDHLSMPGNTAASKGSLAHFLAHYPNLDRVPEDITAPGH